MIHSPSGGTSERECDRPLREGVGAVPSKWKSIQVYIDVHVYIYVIPDNTVKYTCTTIVYRC